jgi:hypothetical protein
MYRPGNGILADIWRFLPYLADLCMEKALNLRSGGYLARISMPGHWSS